MTLLLSSGEVKLSSGLYFLSGEPCVIKGTLVERQIDKILTQYRESPNLLGLARVYLGQLEEVYSVLCTMPQYFDLDTATGEQLTFLGKELGFLRCHCVCVAPTIIGYDCEGGYTGPFTLVGYCEPGSTFYNCPTVGDGEVCLDDDEVYRGFLRARRYQMLGLYDLASLQAAMEAIWGSDAKVVANRPGQITLSPGRTLTAAELTQVPLAFRVFPIAPGIKALLHVGDGPLAGYGAGWNGYCENAEWLCSIDPHAYTCA